MVVQFSEHCCARIHRWNHLDRAAKLQCSVRLFGIFVHACHPLTNAGVQRDIVVQIVPSRSPESATHVHRPHERPGLLS